MGNDSGNPEINKISACGDEGPDKIVRCEVCLTEVPLSVAASAEGLDYVHYFCGLNCLQKWRAQGQPKAIPVNK